MPQSKCQDGAGQSTLDQLHMKRWSFCFSLVDPAKPDVKKIRVVMVHVKHLLRLNVRILGQLQK